MPKAHTVVDIMSDTLTQVISIFTSILAHII